MQKTKASVRVMTHRATTGYDNIEVTQSMQITKNTAEMVSTTGEGP